MPVRTALNQNRKGNRIYALQFVPVSCLFGQRDGLAVDRLAVDRQMDGALFAAGLVADVDFIIRAAEGAVDVAAGHELLFLYELARGVRASDGSKYCSDLGSSSGRYTF